MKRDLMDILACPICKEPLELTVTKEDGTEIIEGNLLCKSCAVTYAIENSIPNLLPPELSRHIP